MESNQSLDDECILFILFGSRYHFSELFNDTTNFFLGISNLVFTLPTTLPKFDQISSQLGPNGCCQGNKLSVRSMVSGEVVCSVDAKVSANLGFRSFFVLEGEMGSCFLESHNYFRLCNGEISSYLGILAMIQGNLCCRGFPEREFWIPVKCHFLFEKPMSIQFNTPQTLPTNTCLEQSRVSLRHIWGGPQSS